MATKPIDLAEIRAGRVAIAAGGGRLPVDLAQHLQAQGITPLIVQLEGEVSDPAAFAGLPGFSIRLEEAQRGLSRIRQEGATHVVLAGTVERRPKISQIRPILPLIPIVAKAAVALLRGDDSILRFVVGQLEKSGLKVVGAHQLMPDLVVSEGVHTRIKPSKADQADIRAGLEAAKAIGLLDIGQAAVSVGGRAIALEGIEGTDGLLERTIALRDHGRLAGRSGGVLVKAAKPDQEMRVDLPSIGVRTIEDAHRAGLRGVAVEADSSLALGFADMVARADELGLFIAGVRAEALK